jgi:hypothetical protein
MPTAARQLSTSARRSARPPPCPLASSCATRTPHGSSASASDRRASRALGPRARGAGAALVASACGSDEGCEFHFANDVVTFEDVPWICEAGNAPSLDILFRPDQSGLLDGDAAFTWQVTSCRTTALTFAEPPRSVDLLEVGGNVAVGRLTFVLDGATYLCGYGTPPP